MTTWWHAGCPTHRVQCTVLVAFNERRERYCDPAYAEAGILFLDEHRSCDPPLIFDPNGDRLDDLGFVDQTPEGGARVITKIEAPRAGEEFSRGVLVLIDPAWRTLRDNSGRPMFDDPLPRGFAWADEWKKHALAAIEQP